MFSDYLLQLNLLWDSLAILLCVENLILQSLICFHEALDGLFMYLTEQSNSISNSPF